MKGSEQHLSSEQLEQLLAGSVERAGGEREDAMRHLEACDQCRLRMFLPEENAAAGLEASTRGKPATTPVCPPEGDWLELAARIMPEQERMSRLEHAAGCRYCGPLLKAAMEDVGMELTPEEESKVASLRSAAPEWQDRLVEKITGKTMERSARKSSRVFLWPRWALAAAVSLLVAAAGWWAWIQFRAPSVDALLAQAYTEQRTIEMRIPGAAYGPMRTKRGGARSSVDRPSSLIKAELLIGERLKQHPADPAWLDAKARADLLDGNYESAIQSLQRAQQAKADSPELMTDLGSAYFLRAAATARAIDYGEAAEFLGKALAKVPDDPVSLFNRAIVYENLSLPNQAIADWEHYLRVDPNSAWSDEARRRLEELQRKMREHQGHNSKPLLNSHQVAVRLAANPEDQEIDRRVEEYFQVALTEWTPRMFSSRPGSEEAVAASQGVHAIAGLLAGRHKDPWLKDFATELERNPRFHGSAEILAGAVRMNNGSNRDLAQRLAQKAANLFRDGKNSAGEMRALFEVIYVDQLAHRAGRCQDEARALTARNEIKSYPWLRIQGLLELAACASLSEESARIHTEEALQLAKTYGYPGLQLRALTFLTGLYRILGDPAGAWQYSAEGLLQYWAGEYPAMRGYSFYAVLGLAAEENQQWRLDVALLREAVGVIAQDPDLTIRAMEHQRLAEALVMTGDLQGAEASFSTMQELFRNSAQGGRRNNAAAEAQIQFAGLDLLRKQPQKVASRLENIRSEIAGIPDKDLEFDFYRNLGLAYLELGDQKRAGENLAPAEALAETSLQANANEQERFVWSRKTDPVYRALTEIELGSSVQQAFSEWEWFKASSLRGANTRLNHQLPGISPARLRTDISNTVPSGAALVSYAFLRDRLAIWVYAAGGLHQIWAHAPRDQIESLARVFAEHCANPDFDAGVLKDEAQKLYQEIVAPVEPLIAGSGRLLIEPDGVLGLVPFEALSDGSGAYIGDHWLISLSPGLHYLAFSPEWRGFSSRLKALIVGNPAAEGLEPLSSAVEEAQMIAALFQRKRLLMGTEATYANIAGSLNDSDVFHFAGHAITNPGRVGLVLGDSSILSVERLNPSTLRRMRLVVLSACSSATGSNGTLDERDSLARLLIGAGVPDVVASRWVVDSSATQILMQEFYRQLLAGRNVSDGLHQAVSSLRAAQPEFAHPFYWAGFSVFGRG